MNWLVVVKKVKLKITYFALLHFILCVSTLFHNGIAGTVIGCRGQLKCDGTQYDLVRKPSTLDALIGYFTPSHVIHQRLLLQFLSAPEDGRKKRPKHVEY